MPTFGADREEGDTDFNDMWIVSGDDAVKAAIDAAVPEEAQEADGADGADNKESDKQSDQLIALAAGADLFHDTDHNPYADLQVNGHRETYPVKSEALQCDLLNS